MDYSQSRVLIAHDRSVFNTSVRILPAGGENSFEIAMLSGCGSAGTRVAWAGQAGALVPRALESRMDGCMEHLAAQAPGRANTRQRGSQNYLHGKTPRREPSQVKMGLS